MHERPSIRVNSREFADGILRVKERAVAQSRRTANERQCTRMNGKVRQFACIRGIPCTGHFADAITKYRLSGYYEETWSPRLAGQVSVMRSSRSLTLAVLILSRFVASSSQSRGSTLLGELQPVVPHGLTFHIACFGRFLSLSSQRACRVSVVGYPIVPLESQFLVGIGIIRT